MSETIVLFIGLATTALLTISLCIMPPALWHCLLVTALGFCWCLWLYRFAARKGYAKRLALAALIANGVASMAIGMAMFMGID